LGLAIVKKIIEEHDGRVELANRTPRGARVTLTFPRWTPVAAQGAR
jgi:nitrogen fixation/metabolism regulation signal transduction histidine kinase